MTSHDRQSIEDYLPIEDISAEASPEKSVHKGCISWDRGKLAAEDMVVAALKEEGFPEDRIERVGHLKLGFDVRAHRVADEATGDVLVKRVEVKGRMRGQPVRLTTNEWYKAQQLAETYWLYVVWDPLGKAPELVRIHNPAVRLDHAKREIVAARFFEIPAEAVLEAGRNNR